MNFDTTCMLLQLEKICLDSTESAYLQTDAILGKESERKVRGGGRRGPEAGLGGDEAVGN